MVLSFEKAKNCLRNYTSQVKCADNSQPKKKITRKEVKIRIKIKNKNKKKFNICWHKALKVGNYL